jgi:hypothetical protein
MTDQENFEAVCQRLMQATGASTEAALAEALGFKPAAFSNRKKRAALPVEEIDELIRQEGLSKDWVYIGKLPMFDAGEKADQLEREFREVIEQIRSSALHNETIEILRPLIRGIVWRDKDVIEGWVQNVGKLTQLERQIIAAFRDGGPEVQAAMTLIAKTGAASSPRTTMTFNAGVGQAIAGASHGTSFVFHDSGKDGATPQRRPRK